MILILFLFNTHHSFSQSEDTTSFHVLSYPIQSNKIQVQIIDMCGCECEAMFPGGAKAMQDWINQNFCYPLGAKELGVQGTVYVTLVIEADGTLSNIEVVKSVSHSIDTEAKRLLRTMPSWIPGELKSKKVRTRVRIPITFILSS